MGSRLGTGRRGTTTARRGLRGAAAPALGVTRPFGVVRVLGVALALGAALLVLPGCYWSKYDKLARTHVELLLAMAQKLEDVAGREGAPPPSLAEYRYPLERARDFTRIAARRFEGRRSLAAFRLLCDAYEQVLLAADGVRGAPESRGPHAAFAAALAALRTQATGVVQALDEEGAG